jgi:hypothetical protein
MMSRTWLCPIVLVAACMNGPYAPGSRAVGDTCEYARDCAAPSEPNAQVHCPCGTCEKTYILQVQCGADAVVCQPDEVCSSLGGPEGGCIKDAKLGGSCAATACLPGLYCDAQNICVEPAAVGGACDPRDESSCAAPAFCAGATSTCALPGGVGAACDFLRYERAECGDGTACSLDNRCVPILDNGASCPDDTGCTSGYCTPDHVCETRSC